MTLLKQAESVIKINEQQFYNIKEGLRDSNIFITGGTGFIGRWLLEYLAYYNDSYKLNLKVTVLTRDLLLFESLHHEVKHLLKNPAFNFVEGDIRNFNIPNGKFTHIIHGAHSTARATFNNEDPLIQFETACDGTRRVLDFAIQAGAKRFLMLSSGSIYGTQNADIAFIPETYAYAPLPQDINSALNQGKRAAEFLVTYYNHKYGLETTIARCFSFIGPGLPLDIHYAVGNFIRDALCGDEIIIRGDGSPKRSYMYVGDLLIWLLVMLTRAQSGLVYNVGSDVSISILEIAKRVRNLISPGKQIKVLGTQVTDAKRNIYVPSILKARAELGLDIWTSLDDTIKMTADFAKTQLIRYNQ